MKFSSTSATLLASASIAFAAPHSPPGGPLPPHVPAVPVGPAHRSPPPPPPPHGNGPKSPGKPRGPPSPKRCENPIVRKEWRALGDVERQEYIDAVLCLQSKEPITKEQFADNVKFNPLNRYDDFQAVHSSQADKIHFVGHFAQWHRYFTAEYERTLRDVCGYKGAQPYWNWSLDANPDDVMSMAAYDSEIFSPTKGFGGNGKWVEVDPSEDIFGLAQFGRSGGGCVQDGPFTRPNFHVNIGEKNGSGQCLRRDFLPGIFNFFADPKTLEKTINEPDFAAFASTLEGRPSFAVSNVHGSGHFGVGGVLGQAGDAANSPGDPLFYLHHSMVDYVYWQWQQKDLENRLHEVGGSTTPSDFSYSSGVNVTLDFEVNLGAIAPSVKVSELLDTEGEILCYTYE